MRILHGLSLFLTLIPVIALAQTHTFPATDTSNGFTSENPSSHINNIVYVDGTTYSCSDVGLNAALAALGTGGGVVDARSCIGPVTIASTITVGANPPNPHGVNLLLPCSQYAWNITVTGGAHVFQITDRSELQGCSLRASVILVANTANIADVVSFVGNPANSNITEYGKVSNLWIENDNPGAIIVNGLLNMQNAFDSVIRDVKLAGQAPCLLYIADTSSAIAPNADDLENLLLDGANSPNTVPVCITSAHGQSVGTIHFRGGDWGHPGLGKNIVLINRSGVGTAHTFGVSFSEIYMESNPNDATTPIIAASDTSALSLSNLWVNRINGSATAPCLSLSDTIGQTSAISVKNFTCTGGNNSNAIISTVKNAPSLAASQVPEYFAPGVTGSDTSSLTGVVISNSTFNNSPVAGGIGAGLSGCTYSSQAGGTWGGKFTSGTSGTCTVTITPGTTAPNGWVCQANDITTPAGTIKQTATETTYCTVSGTTASGDVITWSAIAF